MSFSSSRSVSKPRAKAVTLPATQTSPTIRSRLLCRALPKQTLHHRCRRRRSRHLCPRRSLRSQFRRQRRRSWNCRRALSVWSAWTRRRGCSPLSASMFFTALVCRSGGAAAVLCADTRNTTGWWDGRAAMAPAPSTSAASAGRRQMRGSGTSSVCAAISEPSNEGLAA